jgi:hypothetical protein
MVTKRRIGSGLSRSACAAVLVFAGCGGGESTGRPSASPPGSGGEPVASSGPLRACIKGRGGRGTEVKRPSEGFSGIHTADAFDVVYSDGTGFSVAVEQTPERARRLESATEGVLVELASQSVSGVAPAEMRDAAAETVHRVGNVVILYGGPRHDDDTGIQQCLTEPR